MLTIPNQQEEINTIPVDSFKSSLLSKERNVTIDSSLVSKVKVDISWTFFSIHHFVSFIMPSNYVNKNCMPGRAL